MTKLVIKTEIGHIATTKQLRDVLFGQVFYATLTGGGSITRLYLCVYGGMVSLENPLETWLTPGVEDILLTSYRPVKAVLTVTGEDA